MERDARFLVDLLRDRYPTVRELGQHYLVDTSVLNAAIELAGDLSGKHVLEIGCGPGSLTHHLLHAGARVSAIEIDEGSLEHMHRHFDEELESEQLILIEGDALTVKWPSNIDAIVANIPYQISSPLLERMQREVRTIPAVLLVQEEFAERMAMAIGPLDRGPLGLSLWLDYDLELGRRVPPSCFSPSFFLFSLCLASRTPSCFSHPFLLIALLVAYRTPCCLSHTLLLISQLVEYRSPRSVSKT